MEHRGMRNRRRRGAVLGVLLATGISCGGPPAGPDEPAEPAGRGGRAPAPLRGTGAAEDAGASGAEDEGGNAAVATGGAGGTAGLDAAGGAAAGNTDPTEPAPPREAYSGPGTVVRTAAEFVAAVAPGARIVVVADRIDLSDLWPGVATPLWDDTRDGPPPPAGTEHVRWTNPYDGWQLEIHDLERLEIVGHGSPPPRLVTHPRGSFVLKFVEADAVAIENLTLGHTTPGFCRGGVLAFEKARDVRVRDAELFGSGTYGLELDRVRGAVFERVAVHDCTYGIAVIRDSKEVTFLDSTFRDNEEFELVRVERTRGVRFERCLFEGNRTHGDNPFFDVTASEVELVETVFRNNAVEVFRRGPVRITSGTFEGNPFEPAISPI